MTWFVCDKCKKPIDTIVRIPHSDELVYLLHCHGEVERITLNKETVLEAVNIEIANGYKAFVRQIQ